MIRRLNIRKVLTSHNILYVIPLFFLIIFIFGTLVTHIERNVSFANIESYEDGIWWAFISVTTIGYGDHFPITSTGRLLGAILIGFGLGFFSVITAHLASLFVEADEREEYKQIHNHIKRLEKKIDKLSE